jgi:hypothetical protein
MTTPEFKKKFGKLMKHDKELCEHFEQRDSLLEDLKITRCSKKQTTKFADG